MFFFTSVILVIGDSEMQQHGMRELRQLFISCRPFLSGQKSISSRFMTEVFCKPNRQMIGKPISFVLERESLIILWWFLLGSLCPFYRFSHQKQFHRSLLMLGLGRGVPHLQPDLILNSMNFILCQRYQIGVSKGRNWHKLYVCQLKNICTTFLCSLSSN